MDNVDEMEIVGVIQWLGRSIVSGIGDFGDILWVSVTLRHAVMPASTMYAQLQVT